MSICNKIKISCVRNVKLFIFYLCKSAGSGSMCVLVSSGMGYGG